MQRRSRKSSLQSVEPRHGIDWRRVAPGALAALLIATPLIPSESIAETGAGLFLILLWLLLLAAWAGMTLFTPRAEVRVGPTFAAIVLLVLLIGLSGWLMAWEGNPRGTINSVWQWVAFAAAYFLMRQWIVTPRERRATCTAMIALAVGLSCFGYYQYFISQPAALARFEQDPEGALREAGLSPDADPQTIASFRSRVESVEPIATFALTNSVAGFLAPWLVLAAGIGFTLRNGKFGGKRAAAGVAAGVVAATAAAVSPVVAVLLSAPPHASAMKPAAPKRILEMCIAGKASARARWSRIIVICDSGD
ncbi:MAG: hypothetical protein KY475_25080 [Planctomycetes bacterium]|nr:hypothetical protein [Planctomycetota bacterium]